MSEDKILNTLVVGAGGIGSWVADELNNLSECGQVCADITIADADMVELKQIEYMNFKRFEVGENKAQALADRYAGSGFRPVRDRVSSEEQLRHFDIVIVCVDNEPSRKLIIEACHKQNRDFIDLRATGRRIFAMRKGVALDEDLKFVDANDEKEYSCQEKKDLEKGEWQLGNKIVAGIGCQMLLDIKRGVKFPKVISMVV